MAELNKNIPQIPAEKFSFIHEGERISDKKFDDKPIGYFKDAWIRFRKNRASVVATVIILCIFLYAFIAPLLITNHDSRFMDDTYARKPSRIAWLRDNLGIMDGGVSREFSEKNLIYALGLGVAAEDWEGKGNLKLDSAMDSPYQPVLEIGDPETFIDGTRQEQTVWPGRIDSYLEVGFVYKDIEQHQLQDILAWQEATGKQLLYPLIADNEWCVDVNNANYWYKTNARLYPVTVNEWGEATRLKYKENMVLEDNYLRDADGNPVYYKYWGGGSVETAQYRIRVLYYNWFQYVNDGALPDYLMGTDSVGYDLALRIAGGIKLSLLVAVSVSLINFVIGALYGAVEGYYGGTLDLILERISDILNGVPFIIVATLFQIHLAKKLGPVPCLLFAYVVTGWIGTAYRVRTQFYRFKNQEYVMAARTLGASDSRIIWKHIFPNTLGTLITSSALVIPGTIMSESMLSFLGIVKLGTADATSLGTLLSDAKGIYVNAPHLMLYPALVISLLMICFNLFGNGLRDAFNPALRGVED
ncbi:MAG: ABC transporter permease [Ruminococcaceae bacterium]|nr:ABC transporter permease [Oscillospiraceae bacterium]